MFAVQKKHLMLYLLLLMSLTISACTPGYTIVNPSNEEEASRREEVSKRVTADEVSRKSDASTTESQALSLDELDELSDVIHNREQELISKSELFKTNSVNNEALPPRASIITNLDQLKQYIVNNEDKYNFTGTNADGEQFYDLPQKYTEDFFSEHNLLLVFRSENTQAILQKLSKVEFDRDNGLIHIYIQRTNLGQGLMQPTGWHHLIPLSKGTEGLRVEVHYEN